MAGAHKKRHRSPNGFAVPTQRRSGPKKGQWIAKAQAPDGRVVRATSMRSAAEARERLEARLAGLAASTSAPTVVARPSPFADFEAYAEFYLVERAPATVGTKTLKSYRSFLRRWAYPVIGRIPIAAVSKRDVQDLLADTKRDGHFRTISANGFTCLRSVFRCAMEDGLVTTAPTTGWKRTELPTPPRSKVRRPTPDDLAKVFAHNRDHPDLLLWRLALGTGMRIGEIRSLYWSDLHLEAPEPFLSIERQLVPATTRVSPAGRRMTLTWDDAPTKTAAGERRVALPPTLVRELRAAHGTRSHDLLVFPGRYGDPRSSNWIGRRWREAQVAAGVPPRTFHSLRHTFAVEMLDGGADLRAVSRGIGHSRNETTLDVYGSHEGRGLARDVGIIDKVLVETSPGARPARHVRKPGKRRKPLRGSRPPRGGRGRALPVGGGPSTAPPRGTGAPHAGDVARPQVPRVP